MYSIHIHSMLKIHSLKIFFSKEGSLFSNVMNVSDFKKGSLHSANYGLNGK